MPAKRPEVSAGRDFAHYGARIDDITPDFETLPAGSHPFPTKYADRTSQMTFNIADYSRQLMNDFLIAGGVIETQGVSVTARCDVGAAAGDHQLPWVRRQKALVG